MFFSATEIANYLGMALETVSRVLGKLQASNVIDVNPRMVKINNMAALNNCLYDGDCLHMGVVQGNNLILVMHKLTLIHFFYQQYS
jgi:hypothetical protein|tara:strand:+ start:579 stop:836 length:258 start_codon:yes stop_codon:yes gene_type:complete